MTLKDISYNGLLKLALIFIIIPRLFSRIYNFITRPIFEKISEFQNVTGIRESTPTETNSQNPDPLYEFALDQILFIITLLVSVFILTKLIEYLAENTKLGNMNLSERPK